VPLAHVLELKSVRKRHGAGPEVRPSADRRDGRAYLYRPAGALSARAESRYARAP